MRVHAVVSSPSPAPIRAASGAVADAQLGRASSLQRRRQLSQGKRGLNGAVVAPVAAPLSGASGSGAVADAQLGRASSLQRRRQLSQGKRGLNGAVVAPVPASPAPAPAPAGSGAVADAQLGRASARQRRRQLTQGKRGLNAGAEASAQATGSGRVRPERGGQLGNAPKVLESPTQGGLRVTGVRIGPGVRVTGDEPGRGMAVSGSQYVPDGSAESVSGKPKVGLVRTAKGLVVSGTAVRSQVAITGDEFGEHIAITGEADQKVDDDLTPRSGAAGHRSGQFPRKAQFPRKNDPRPAPSPRSGSALETSDGGRDVTGTAVGRSGRVTGNEAGESRALTGDQYQRPSSATEWSGTDGVTAPAAGHGGSRLDPVTGGKVTEALTWRGQRVTGPNVEHSPNVTGDEPGSCRPVTGTPYQGPGTAIGWCETAEGDAAGQRLDARAGGVAVTGDVPMHAEAVTGTERGRSQAVTGTSYHHDMRAAEPVPGPWSADSSFPIALARRGGPGEVPDGASDQDRVTGSFAVAEGKVTGNNEFVFRPRRRRDAPPTSITGEGSTEGREVTGSAWTSNKLVTGTEGYISAGRNPTEARGESHAWAGATRFREKSTPSERRQNITGQSGQTTNTTSRITLSGGASA
ncbi:CsoS2 family carboxysome shell protein [Pseudonocardia sp. N23]|uniref:CsoS2 family carboxysome shell protein n=1 Tax=Pseudonocardia sp. N23 TaxID=1987376 RepID=UPI000C02AE1C|nr:CsoS2 family carboxysome shell protein [Pseudonocardia sp. N23]GAY10004.1 carboxysome shell protein CsoS2 [Pseudonocardia sp. N23]